MQGKHESIELEYYLPETIRALIEETKGRESILIIPIGGDVDAQE